MAKRFFTHLQWFGNEFHSFGVELSEGYCPSEHYYQAFCEELFYRFPSYDSFPNDWKDEKRGSAAALANVLDPELRVLAYGCGSGFVEHCLMHVHGFRDLWFHDQLESFSRYLPTARGREWEPGHHPV